MGHMKSLRQALPDRLKMTAFVDGDVLAGVALIIHIPTRKNAIVILPFGPSGEAGEYTADAEVLYCLALVDVNTGIMDYGDHLGELWVRVANPTDIAECRQDFAVWSTLGSSPTTTPICWRNTRMSSSRSWGGP